MHEKCPEGKIWRVGHTKTSKKTSKKINVEGKCIRATSQTGKKTSISAKHKLEKLKAEHKQVMKKFPTPKCKSGEIVRTGYKKKSRSGKIQIVKPICVKDTGKKGKMERMFYIEPERLSVYGYTDLESRTPTERHGALKKAFSEGEKPLSVMRRLVALSTVTKNTKPKLSGILREDAEWVKATKEYNM